MESVAPFLYGVLTVTCLTIGVKFLKFWRLSRDRFFIWFTIAFWTFAAGWIVRAFVPSLGEDQYIVYIPRLLGFLTILAAIYDKNRRT